MIYILALAVIIFSCNNDKKSVNEADSLYLSETEMSSGSILTLVQKQTFNYFFEGYEPNSGKACERIHIYGEYPGNDQNVAEESLNMMRFLYASGNTDLIGKYVPYDAFSREYNWGVQRYLAIGQETIRVMIENGRKGILWDLFMSSPEIQDGLAKLKFTSWRIF